MLIFKALKNITNRKFWQILFVCLSKFHLSQKKFWSYRHFNVGAVKLPMFGHQAVHVCTKLEQVFFSSKLCPHLDENDSNRQLGLLRPKMVLNALNRLKAEKICLFCVFC